MNQDQTRTEGGGGQELNRADVTLAAALFIVALVLRIPFRSQFAYHWDSAQFAFAVRQYNIRINQPHPPGYYWYILLARIVNFWVGEPHAALVWLSVIGGAWLVAVGYLLGKSMFGHEVGLGTGLILLTSPLCWFHSEIALSTIVDSALVVSFVFVCWRALQRGGTWFRVVLMAAGLAAIAGVRQLSALPLVPLWIYVIWRSARPRGSKLLGSIALMTGFCLLWFVPTVKSAGNLASYVHLLRLKTQIDAPRIVWEGGGVGALLSDASCMGRACWIGLLAAGLIAVAELVCWTFFEEPAARTRFYQASRVQLRVLALWIAPMVLFYLVMCAVMPGHVLNFFPAITLLASLGLIRFAERLAISSRISRSYALGCVFALVAGLNAVVFIWAPRWTTPLQMGLPLTSVEIRQHDAGLSACFQTIRSKWSPGNVVIYHRFENFYWGYAQFKYYLPEYKNVQVWDVPPVVSAADILLVVPPGESLDLFRPIFDLRGAFLVEDDGVKLFCLRH